MKHTLLILISLFGSLCYAQQTDPIKSLNIFFEGFHNRDSLKIKSVLSLDAKLFRTGNSKDGIPKRQEMSMTNFIKVVSSRPETPVWKEELGVPILSQHQNLAQIWVPFSFYLDGELSHCGFNAFQLFWDGTTWLITELSDTATKQCR
ncbi:hypothetical protein N9W60_06200 [Flavobacteriaceae bacterium]|nr:hypothetical protein [Flavobacteriaceae bacterium]